MAKPLLPKRLTAMPAGRADPGECGWRFVRALDAGALEAEHWGEHSEQLTREERSHLAHDRGGPIVRPLKPGWESGDRLDIASNLWADVLEVKWRRGGYRTSLVLVDFRPRFPRKTTPRASEKKDESGRILPPTLEEIEEAHQDGAYTQTYALAAIGIDEEVDEATQDAITKGALAHYNVLHAEQLAKREIRSLSAQLQEARATAAKKGIDISPEVEDLKKRVAELKQKVGAAA